MNGQQSRERSQGMRNDLTSMLVSKAADRSAHIAVIGQGYVGLPLALVFAEGGFQVTGFDVDPHKVEAINRGESYIRHLGAERVTKAVKSGKLSASADFDRLDQADAIFICVPTPLGKHREPDNSYIHNTARAIAHRLRPGQLVVLESTTYPGTTDDEVRPILEDTGLRCPDQFLLAFSPEREDPGNKSFSTKNTPKLVGGVNPQSTEAAVAMYASVLDRVVPVANAKVAESAKLLENVFRSVNIALVNELKTMFERMGIDIWEVIEAAKTKPFGFMPFYPGPGLGGHCIPLDPFYLSWKAAEHGFFTRFIKLAGEINTEMPRHVVNRVSMALNQDRKCVNGSRILILGMAYKANVDDDRESPSYEVIDMLRQRGASISYCDPYIPFTHQTRKHNLSLHSVPCTGEEFAKYDAVVVMAAHEEFKNPELYRQAKVVIDTRNVLAGLGLEPGAPRVVKA